LSFQSHGRVLLASVSSLVRPSDGSANSEVLREALRLLKERQYLKQMQIEHVRKLVQEGLDSGPAESWDIERIKRKGRERLKDKKN